MDKQVSKRFLKTDFPLDCVKHGKLSGLGQEIENRKLSEGIKGQGTAEQKVFCLLRQSLKRQNILHLQTAETRK